MIGGDTLFLYFQFFAESWKKEMSLLYCLEEIKNICLNISY